MGLLSDYLPDFLPEDQDKREAARTGLLNFAGGLLSSKGNFGNALGTGLLYGSQGYQSAYKSALDQKKENLQMDMLKQQVAQASRKNDLVNNMLAQYGMKNPQASNAPSEAISSALSSGSSAGSVGPTMANANRLNDMTPSAPQQSGMVNGVPMQAIAHDLAFNDGKNLGDWMFKRGVPDIQVSNGYAYDKNQVKPGYLPQLNMSQDGKASMTQIGPDGLPVVSAPTGALKTYSDYQNVEQQAKNRYQTTTLNLPSGPRMVLNSQLPEVVGQEAPATPFQGSDLFTQLPQSLQQRMIADAKRTGDPKALIDYKLPDGRALKGAVDFSAPAQQQNSGPGIALQDEADKQRQLGDVTGKQGTLNEINKNWIGNAYNPIVQAGQEALAAKNNITALRGIDLKTGSGAETKAAMANFLTGIGLAPDNAKLYATNAQRFQSVAMDTLINKFAAQKGVQTEGDARRVASTYAQLSNTPEANSFIADFAEANANMAARKSAYYQAALPHAQKEGDLTKIDREWQKIQGSIWDDKLMSRWGKK